MPLTREEIEARRFKFGFAFEEYNAAKWNEKMTCICMHCGNPVYILKKYLVGKRDANIFCSSKCAHIYRGHLSVECVCETCGKTFTKSASQLYDHNFCSQSCAAKYNNKLRPQRKLERVAEEHECSIDEAAQYVVQCKKHKEAEKRKQRYVCSVCGTAGCDNPICKIFSFQREYDLAKQFGMSYEHKGTKEHIEQYDRVKQAIEQSLKECNNSIVSFMLKHKISEVRTAQNFLKSFGVEFERDFVIPKTLERFNRGYHTTWNGKTFFYRSSYELDYMKHLDDERINYDVATKQFWYFNSTLKRKCKAYPDFILPDSNTIVEVKSFLTYNQQEMEDKKKAYEQCGYKFKLVLEHEEFGECVPDKHSSQQLMSWTDIASKQ